MTPINAASSPPLYQASSYSFEDFDQLEGVYAGELHGKIYGRYGGPNGEQFALAMAELEGAEAAIGAASGMAALDAVLAVTTKPGEPIVAGAALYGGTIALLENDYQNEGRNPVVAVDAGRPEAVAAAFVAHPTARLVVVEAVSNPLGVVADVPALAEIAHRHGALLAVDATFVTPVLGRPLALRADLVIHSVGKYLGGHADVGAGVVAGRAALVEPIAAYLVRRGAPIAHFEAWLAMRGLRTLGLRMARHAQNAAEVAAFLEKADGVARVHHASLPGHPHHALARRLYPAGLGGIVAFDLAGGRAEVAAFLRGLERIAMVNSLGEVATTIAHCASSSHRFLTPEARAALGVSDATLRLSCGIEDARDIIADLARGLAGIPRAVPASEALV